MFSYIREELLLRKYIEVAKKLLKQTVGLSPESPELSGYSARTCVVAHVHCLLAMGLRFVSRAEATSGLRRAIQAHLPPALPPKLIRAWDY